MTAQGSVLLIDRDSELVSLVSTYLNSEGYRVVFTTRAREALKKLANQRFSHIFIDPELEPDNVNEIFDELMTTGHMNHKTPVTLTTFNLEFNVSMQFAKRMTSILPKPFTLPEFYLQLQIGIKGDKKKAS